MAEVMKSEVKVEPKKIRAVHGRMVDPHTGEQFDLEPKPCGKITGWMQAQVDAGKLALA